jgi:hypothetical protein
MFTPATCCVLHYFSHNIILTVHGLEVLRRVSLVAMHVNEK